MISDNGQIEVFKRAGKYLLSFLLTAIFLIIAFYNVNIKETIANISVASPLYIELFILIFLASHFLRAVRWKVILSSTKSDVKLSNLFYSLMLGYGVNCVLPRVGEVTRAVLVGKWENLSKSSLLGTVILERIIDVIFFAISLLIAVYISTQSLYVSFPWLKTTLFLTMILLLIFIIFLFLALNFKNYFNRLLNKTIIKISPKLADKITDTFNMLIKGFSSLKGFNNYLMTILLSIAIILLYATNSYIGFLMLGLDKTYPVNFGWGWIIMSLSSIATAIPTPNGIGSYHLLTKTALMMLFGIKEAQSLAYAFLTHIISYILFIITAIIIFLFVNKRITSYKEVLKSNPTK